jgi:large subunit ribosomal protein L33
MPKEKSSRILFTLECINCRLLQTTKGAIKGISRYLTTKNRKKNIKKIILQKYCKFCGNHQPHQEIK